MSVSLEWKKVKRTGFLPTFLFGGFLTAAVPVIHMAARSEVYLSIPGNPVQILFGANWQMMAMLNVLLVVTGACLLYHTEYAENAMQKMKSLPTREGSIFLGKAILMISTCLFVLLIEAGAVAFCSYHWFGIRNNCFAVLCQYFGYAFMLMLPCVILSLLISEGCKNMWVSLGISVVCVFIATMMPAGSFILSLFPFAMPFRVFAGADAAQSIYDICAAAAELIILGAAEMVFTEIRRSFE